MPHALALLSQIYRYTSFRDETMLSPLLLLRKITASIWLGWQSMLARDAALPNLGWQFKMTGRVCIFDIQITTGANIF
jgi:hypothetical protein